MGKWYKGKAAKEFAGFFEANCLEWSRLSDNRELKDAISKIQEQYGLPISPKKFNFGFGWTKQKKERLWQEIKELAMRFEMPDWGVTLYNWAVFDSKGPATAPPVFPLIERDLKTGKPVIKITPETAEDNQIVRDMIHEILDPHRERPPQPQPAKDNSRRLDWQPVYEWWLLHPEVGDKEIAKMLHRGYSNVRKKLAQLRNSHKK